MDLKSIELNLFGKVNDDLMDPFIHLPITVLNNYTPGIIIKPPDTDNDRYSLSVDKTIFEWRCNITFPESVLKKMGWSKQESVYIVHGKYNADIVQVVGFTATYNPKQELEGENIAVLILPLDYLYDRFYPMHLSKNLEKGKSIDLTTVNLAIRFSPKVEDPSICLSRDLIDKLQLEDTKCNQAVHLY